MRTCGCPDVPLIEFDEAKHAEWHKLIEPLTRADSRTLEENFGRPSVPTRTYVDDQFEQARAKYGKGKQL